jgi:hypothetical protein
MGVIFMAINLNLAHLREVYAQIAQPPKPINPWAIVALLVPSAAIALFGNSFFATIGILVFCVGALLALRISKDSYVDDEATRMLATPGFFEFAMQRDQRWLAGIDQMRSGFNHFMVEPRPAAAAPG